MNKTGSWGGIALAALVCAAAAGCGSSQPKTAATTITTTTLPGLATTPAKRATGGNAATAKRPKGSSTSTATSTGRTTTEGAAPSSGHTPSPPTQQSSPPPGGYSPQLKAAVTSFVNCMDEHGVKLPPPNFSAGPNQILSSGGVNTASPTFVQAIQACELDLLGIIRAGGVRFGTEPQTGG